MHKFTSTNKSPRSSFAGVRVYNEAGDKVVEYELSKHSALNYLRKHNGKHRKAFIAQCLDAGVSQNEIDNVLTLLK
jgi:hypothetical protein